MESTRTTTPGAADTWLTPEQVGEVLGIHRKTVIARINDGTLAAHRVGRLWRIHPDALPDHPQENA